MTTEHTPTPTVQYFFVVNKTALVQYLLQVHVLLVVYVLYRYCSWYVDWYYILLKNTYYS